MKVNKDYDGEIKSVLFEQAEGIKASRDLFDKIEKNINELECGKVMKNKSIGLRKSRRIIAMAASFILLASLTVWGITNGSSWIGHSNHKYKNFPSEKQIIKDVGFAPKYHDSLPGGFEYHSGGTGESKLLDETGNILTTTKEVSLGYKRGNEKSLVNLTITQLEESFLDHGESELIGNIDGVDLYYYEKDYKFVPPNYELTDEDKIAHEAGQLEISYGASEISIENIQSISWYENGLMYSIMGGDYNFTIDQMVDMAEFVIEQ